MTRYASDLFARGIPSGGDKFGFELKWLRESRPERDNPVVNLDCGGTLSIHTG